MTIPDKPLELTVDVSKLTLEEAAIFDTEEAQANTMTWLNKLRKFLLKYSSSWTTSEINALQIDEMEAVAEHLSSAIQAASVPLANSEH
jgi:hypothetical protein